MIELSYYAVFHPLQSLFVLNVFFFILVASYLLLFWITLHSLQALHTNEYYMHKHIYSFSLLYK